MKKKSLINYFCLGGILAFVFYLLHDIIGALNYPGYNAMSQAVSDLTATNAPSFIVASAYSSIHSIFACICCILVCILVKIENKILKLGVFLFTFMTFISAIGYSIFPLSDSGFDGSFQSVMHVYVITTIVVLSSIISLILIAVGSFRGENKHKLLGICAIIAFILMFIGAVASQNVSKEVFGIFERFSTYSAVLFTTILGIFGFSKNTNIE